jgi:hypothetical protein
MSSHLENKVIELIDNVGHEIVEKIIANKDTIKAILENCDEFDIALLEKCMVERKNRKLIDERESLKKTLSKFYKMELIELIDQMTITNSILCQKRTIEINIGEIKFQFYYIAYHFLADKGYYLTYYINRQLGVDVNICNKNFDNIMNDIVKQLNITGVDNKEVCEFLIICATLDVKFVKGILGDKYRPRL